MLGEHVVEITTGEEIASEDDDTVETVAEKVPAKYYNLNSELLRTVERGCNVFDFPLESSGEIVTEDDLVAQEEEGGAID